MLDILRALILPSGFAVLLTAVALVLLLLRRGRRAAVWLLVLSGGIVAVFSSSIVAALLLSPLEYRYPALDDPSRHPEATRIVVLTGYAAADALMPLSSYVNGSSAFRLLEAKHIYLRCARCEVIVSGYADASDIMRNLLVELGIPAARIRIDGASPHTDESALNLRALLGERPFFLVTSAGHMPRAMQVFAKQGLRPIPAPTDYSLPKDPLAAGITLSPLHLYFSDLAINEYAGLAWYRLTGKI